MSYHIVNIDSPQCSISCKRGQLTCKSDDGQLRQIPLEDVAAIVVTSFSANLHSHLLLEAAKKSVPLILCERFKPVSLLLPANRASDTLLTKASIALPQKVKDGLWRKSVDAKCFNQSLLAAYLNSTHPKIEALTKTATGKSAHKEATCARYYWSIWSEALGEISFKRERDSGGINDLLNFGYAVLLSIVLQKLLAFGLDPTFGISHAVRERSTPLAFDLMEPFRPCVDHRVAKWMLEEARGEARIESGFRRYVSQFVLERVGYLGIEMTLHHCVEAVVRSFRQAVMEGKVRPYQPWTPQNSRWVG